MSITGVRSYPYTAWKVTPTSVIKKVNILDLLAARDWEEWDMDDNGRGHRISILYGSPEEALTAGLATCKERQAVIDKKQANLNKRIATLETYK